jgi:hypothetical protein
VESSTIAVQFTLIPTVVVEGAQVTLEFDALRMADKASSPDPLLPRWSLSPAYETGSEIRPSLPGEGEKVVEHVPLESVHVSAS